jgi:hydrogenase expression/formation protein HypD
MDRFVQQACERLNGYGAALAGRGAVRIMEVCGTHTMAIARSGLGGLLPGWLELISGPGCPVCVTEAPYLDQALHLAGRAEAPVIATYGDMVRVPGRDGSLAEARARGAKVEVVYSARKAVELARRNPGRQVVFLAVGFETTAPGTALALLEARRDKLANLSVLVAHKLIVPAMRALLAAGDAQIDGFLCPGHVSVIIGYEAYAELAEDSRKPCVVAGFDPPQIFQGIEEILAQLAGGTAQAVSVYPSAGPAGNPEALRLLNEVFVPADAAWRGIGTISQSGLVLREAWREFDAATRFDLPETASCEPPDCRCGKVIRGRCRPRDCALFGTRCTPRDPVGPCMVSSEGACAAAYKYGPVRAKPGKAVPESGRAVPSRDER